MAMWTVFCSSLIIATYFAIDYIFMKTELVLVGKLPTTIYLNHPPPMNSSSIILDDSSHQRGDHSGQ
eukprot:CAMPEP_0201678816 /NCGR_PEP_ID=MMETSP0494-20130426/47047_1 /ASSEMBLY_ACC=CAM_ASM_000839 /TAXON_ID=420259 /ORGANISM="Thalassiosira gravida, Strain GMp14c1" /LENGTH=66 /DNA_ID=CAMNT_0048162099 /DNA_START=252 /DNA_END=452 /DNA_ORIENTATION=-